MPKSSVSSAALSLGLLFFTAGCSTAKQPSFSALPKRPSVPVEEVPTSNVAPMELPSNRYSQTQKTLTAEATVVDFINALDGQAHLLGADGAFLGIVSIDRFHETSVCNKFGTFGSRFENMSVWNRFGNYGNQISDLSAYHNHAPTPPAIVYQKNIIGFLTKNRRQSDGLDPDLLFAVLCNH